MEKYLLEITMESKLDTNNPRCIKRSFPAEKGTLPIGRYGYPFERYRTVEIGDMHIDGNIKWLNLTFDGEAVRVPLNEFVTVRRNYEFMEARASVKHFEVVHTTFYLYIE
jgi:hypothetical protein